MFIKGEDRILFFKINGVYFPIGCLTDNSFDESSEMLDTTTRDNGGWTTSIPIMQSYSLSFSGLQVNSTAAGGNFNVASYDSLKKLKRDRILLDWKLQGTTFPVVDYGKCYINSLSESAPAGDLITFSGSAIGFGQPLTADLGITVLNNGDPNIVIITENNLIRTSEV